MSKLKFELDETLCNRQVEFSTTLTGEHISHYVEAFIAFLRATGFAEDSIKEYINYD